jgi:hypothetical protein
MDRKTRRNNERIISTIKKKAVKDTETWILSLSSPPTKSEVLAFQAGYVYGINRGTSNA